METKPLHLAIAIVAALVFFSIFFQDYFFPRVPVLEVYQDSLNRAVSDTRSDQQPATNQLQPVGSPQLLLDGLVITQDLQLGEGFEAKEGSTVSISYIGSTINPETNEKFVFDQTDASNPFTFVLGSGQVIPGFDAGVSGMREGGVRIILIEPEAGYGNRTVGSIPPNSRLEFFIELLKVQ